MLTVFISHSARENSDAQAVCHAVEQGLQDKNYDVYIDSRLVAGQQWASELYVHLAACHAAVVLLSTNALESDWVKREVNILLWRYALGVPVRIVPALIGGLTEVQAATAGFGELQSLQFAKSKASESAAANADIANQIVRRFADQPPFEDDSPMCRWVGDIADCVSNASERSALTKAARELGVADARIEQIADSNYGPNLLAHEFLEPKQTSRRNYLAVTELSRRMTRDRLDRLATLIAPTWVNGESARQLLINSERPGVVMLNSVDPTTAEQYIKRASCCAVDGYGTQTVVIGREGEWLTTDFLEQCELAVKRFLGIHIRRRLDPELAKSGGPPENRGRCFLIVDTDGSFEELDVVAEAIKEVMDKYPWVTVVMLTGESLPPADRWGLKNVLVLPELAEADENAGFTLTENLKNLVASHTLQMGAR